MNDCHFPTTGVIYGNCPSILGHLRHSTQENREFASIIAYIYSNARCHMIGWEELISDLAFRLWLLVMLGWAEFFLLYFYRFRLVHMHRYIFVSKMSEKATTVRRIRFLTVNMRFIDHTRERAHSIWAVRRFLPKPLVPSKNHILKWLL